MSAAKPYAIRDLVATMRTAKSAKVGRGLISNAKKRLADIEFVGWPSLEKSLRDELEQLQEIAREKGFAR